MNLKTAFRIQPGDSIAFSGAGGKTTAMFTLARQIGGPVVATTTTHFSKDQLGFADQILDQWTSRDIRSLKTILKPGVNLLVGELGPDERVSGIAGASLDVLHQLTKELGINLLIEADGARKRPLKAPADHEPVIPSFIDIAAVVAGLSGVGEKLTSQTAHRVEKYAELAGIEIGDELTLEAVARVLKSEAGGLKGIPEGARRVCVLNQADDPRRLSEAKRLASNLIPPYEAILITSFLGGKHVPHPGHETGGIRDGVHAVLEPVTGIILAAGGSQRMGKPKQLLQWKGSTIIRHVVENALSAGFDQAIVVLGASSEKIKSELSDLAVEIVVNDNWEAGQSSSIQAGLEMIPNQTGAVVFLLGDQPQVSPVLINSLIEMHTSSLAPIIAPMVDGSRGNPVLFDRSTFADFRSLQGDTGGRELFSRYPVTWLEWHDPSVLTDIDTDEDYQHLLSEST